MSGIQIRIDRCAHCGTKQVLDAAIGTCLNRSGCVERQLEQLQAQAAALRAALLECKRLVGCVLNESDIIDLDWIAQAAAAGLADDAGQALLAELAAAQAVVEAARLAVAGPDSTNYMALWAALDAYDEAAKGAKGES